MWADELASEIITTRGNRHLVASGISPSGPIHLGNLREIMTASVTNEALQRHGATSKLIYIADDFDRLRKVYPFLPPEFEQYVGHPLSKIPDPWGCHPNYAEHFLAPFFNALDQLGVEVEKISATRMYETGKYTEVIRQALAKRAEIARLLTEISQRDLPENWSPFDPLCEACGRIEQAKITDYDLDHNRVKYACRCGHTGWADFSKGQGKLSWRVDWPARWKMLGVTVEPFGKEHGTVGGSYDTGVAIARDIYNYEPPFPARYEFIYLKGTQGKMSSSQGNVVAAEDMLQIVPPQLIRYILFRIPFNRHLDFDPGQGLMHIVDEYSRLEAKYLADPTIAEASLYEYCQIKKSGQTVPQIPFRHLVMAAQAGRGQIAEVRRILSRTDHAADIDDAFLQDQIVRVQTWLKNYAPEEMKFSLQPDMPASARNLTDEQKHYLKAVTERLEPLTDWTGDNIHKILHDLKTEQGISPKDAFSAVYRVFIDKESGPQAGWFLGALDKTFVIARLKEVA